jgi:hypothetical protein
MQALMGDTARAKHSDSPHQAILPARRLKNANGRFAKERHIKIKKCYLMIAFVTVSIIALLYGISPRWFSQTVLNVPEMSVDFAYILRAVTCLF